MKKVFMVFLLTGFLFPLAAQEYKVCLSSVLKAESAEYLSKGFNADGIATVYEAAVVHGRLFIRILTAETYGSLSAAVRAKNSLSRSTFISAQGIGDLWIRTYPAPWKATDFVSRQIPYFRQEEPVGAAASSQVPARDVPSPAVPASPVRESAAPPVRETTPDRGLAPPPPEPAAPVREATPPPEAPPVASPPPVVSEGGTPPAVPAGAAVVTVKPEAAPQPPVPKPLTAPVPAKADIAASESPVVPADLEPEELPAADAEAQSPAEEVVPGGESLPVVPPAEPP
ncbi:MAG: hypothetical protein JW760_13270, partial [Spirochaetales bacterium]|nr:hypothetical protein [Spirochaetales bacterium]